VEKIMAKKMVTLEDLENQKIEEKIEVPEALKIENHDFPDFIGNFGKASDEISILMKSRQSLIYIKSNESETRILRIIDRICQSDKVNLKRKLYIWDMVNGITERDFASKKPRITATPVSSETKDPLMVLDHIISSNPEEVTCFVLCEFHHYLDNPPVMRRLRNFVELCVQSHNKTIILLSPDNNGMANGKQIPPELENIVYMMDWPIPDETVLRKVFEDEIIPVSNKQIKNANERFKKRGEPERDLVSYDKENIDRIVNSAKGLTINDTLIASYRSLVEKVNIVPETILKSKKQIVRKKGLVDYIEPSEDENLDNLGGLANLKRWLNARKPILTEKAREFGCDLPNGVMLIGPWGTGKSSVAKAITNEWKLPCLRIDASKIFAMYVGSSESNVKSVLTLAESIAPCCLHWDECDDFFSGSESSSHSDGGTTSRVIGIISTWMAEHEGIVFNIFTANDISQRPPKLFRKGRLDEIFIVELPVESERKDIFRIHIDKRREKGYSEKNIYLDALAKESKMFSGAEIKDAVNTGFIAAFNENMRNVTTEDVLKAIRETIPISCTMKEKLTEIRRWQEGRAVRASDNKPEDIIDVEEYRRSLTYKENEGFVEI
jgi:ATP-dependent 26S proteasome regulatory subunit